MLCMKRVFVCALVGMAIASAPALAQDQDQRQAKKKPATAKIVGATLAHTIEPTKGFIDDPFQFDGGGSRLVYVNSDAASRAEAVVWDLAQQKPIRTVDLSAFTIAPLRVEPAIDGDHLFVVVSEGDGGRFNAALIDPAGKVVRRYGPASEVLRTRYGGKDAVVLYSVEEKRAKNGPRMVHHSVEVFALETGKRLGKKTELVTDLNGYSKQLDFSLKGWRNEYTVAVGIQGGRWNKKEDQRSPDAEGWYELPRRSFVKTVAISDPMAHTKKMQALANHPNETQRVQVADDLSGLVRVVDGDAAPIELSHPFRAYDHTTLRAQTRPDGTIFFTLEIDPVNPEAAARKRAEVVWLDLYELLPGATRAMRRARLRLDDQSELSWRATSSTWAVVPRHVGFDRGGKLIRLYALDGSGN